VTWSFVRLSFVVVRLSSLVCLSFVVRSFLVVVAVVGRSRPGGEPPIRGASPCGLQEESFMRRSRSAVLLLIAGLLLASPLMAQEQRESIQGVVKDTSGGVLPGVTVEARSAALVGVSAAVTDERAPTGSRPCLQASTK